MSDPTHIFSGRSVDFFGLNASEFCALGSDRSEEKFKIVIAVLSFVRLESNQTQLQRK